MSRIIHPLTEGEARLPLAVGVSEPLAIRLRKEGRVVPAPMSVTACIDTEAEGSCISLAVPERLAVPCSGWTKFQTPAEMSGGKFAGLYEVSFRMKATEGRALFLPLVRVAGFRDLHPLGFDVLIGQDILAAFDFQPNRPTGSFTLRYRS